VLCEGTLVSVRVRPRPGKEMWALNLLMVRDRRSVALERPVNRDCGGSEASVISRRLLA
jgi:hypothetical protein